MIVIGLTYNSEMNQASELKKFFIKNGIECLNIPEHLEIEHQTILKQIQGGSVVLKRLTNTQIENELTQIIIGIIFAKLR